MKKTFHSFAVERFDPPSAYNPDMDIVSYYGLGSRSTIGAEFQIFTKGAPFRLTLTPVNVTAFGLPSHISSNIQSHRPDREYFESEAEEIVDEWYNEEEENVEMRAHENIDWRYVDLKDYIDQYIQYFPYPLKSVIPYDIVPDLLKKEWGMAETKRLILEANERGGLTDMDTMSDNLIETLWDETPEEFFWMLVLNKVITTQTMIKKIQKTKNHRQMTMLLETVVKYLEARKKIPYFSVSSEAIGELAGALIRSLQPPGAWTNEEQLVLEYIEKADLLEWLVEDKILTFPDAAGASELFSDVDLFEICGLDFYRYLESNFLDNFVYEVIERDLLDEIIEEMMRDLQRERDDRIESLADDLENDWESDEDEDDMGVDLSGLDNESLKKLSNGLKDMKIYSVVLSGGITKGTIVETKRVFGLVSNILYKIAKQEKLDGLIFYGSSGSRHGLYRQMLKTKSFVQDFSKLGYQAIPDSKHPALPGDKNHLIVSKELMALLDQVAEFKKLS